MVDNEGVGSALPWRLLGIGVATLLLLVVALWFFARADTTDDGSASTDERNASGESEVDGPETSTTTSTAPTTAASMEDQQDADDDPSGESEPDQELSKPLSEQQLSAIEVWFSAMRSANVRAGRFGSDIMMARTVDPAMGCDEKDVFDIRYAEYAESGLLTAEWVTEWDPDLEQAEQVGDDGDLTIPVTVIDTIDGDTKRVVENFVFRYSAADDTVVLRPEASLCAGPASTSSDADPVRAAVLASLDGTETGDTAAPDYESVDPEAPRAPWSTGPVRSLGAVADVVAAWNVYPIDGCVVHAPLSLALGGEMTDYVNLYAPQQSRVGDFQFGFTDGVTSASVSIWESDNVNPQRFMAENPDYIAYSDGSRMYVLGRTFLIIPARYDCAIEVFIESHDPAIRSHIISSVRPVG